VFIHEQTIASTTWIINHSFGNKVVFDVIIPNNLGILEKVYPLTVVHLNDNTLVVSFSSPHTGFANVIG
jgi:hypothetical protein